MQDQGKSPANFQKELLAMAQLTLPQALQPSALRPHWPGAWAARSSVDKRCPN